MNKKKKKNGHFKVHIYIIKRKKGKKNKGGATKLAIIQNTK